MKTSQLTALLLATLALGLATAAASQEDVGPHTPTFHEGDTIGLHDVNKLKNFLPEEFWSNRDFFFYEGMHLEIGPFYKDYSPAKIYQEATTKYAGQAKIGPEASLSGHRAGQPFPIDKIDCKGDPQAGAKIAWDFVKRWDGFGGAASFYYSYWDRGEELPLYYEGNSNGAALSYRPEPQFDQTEGDVFRGEKRLGASGPTVEAPFDARGIMLLTYRYKASQNPKATTKNDDTWVYVPTLRRVRRISSAQRTDAVSGTDFTFDDLFSFNGIVPQYEWKCLGEMDMIGPGDTKVRGYPYARDHNFGPYGLSYADDVWEMRHAVKIRFIPRLASHPYKYKDIYIDMNSMEPMYSFAYDRKGELWKIIWHAKRWSDDPDYTEYKGWKGVPDPRDLTVVSDTIVNVQTGTGNRIEFYDRSGTAFKSKGKLRRFIDVGRLTRGR